MQNRKKYTDINSNRLYFCIYFGFFSLSNIYVRIRLENLNWYTWPHIHIQIQWYTIQFEHKFKFQQQITIVIEVCHLFLKDLIWILNLMMSFLLDQFYLNVVLSNQLNLLATFHWFAMRSTSTETIYDDHWLISLDTKKIVRLG